MHRCFTKNCTFSAPPAMERNLTQREYEELNSRREAAGRPPLSYRDANRQARRPTTRQRQARQQGVGTEGSGTEVSSEARARPLIPQGRKGREMREAAAPRHTPGQGTGGTKTGEHGAGRILIGGSTRTQRLLPQRPIHQRCRLSRQTQYKMKFGSWIKWRSLLMRRSAHQRQQHRLLQVAWKEECA